MDRTSKILIIIVIVLVAVLSISVGYILNGLVKENNTTTIQSNISVNTSPSTTTNNASSNMKHNDVPYRITSNTPDCPNCGSNNIAQLSDTQVDTNTNEWVVESQCRYCGYQWEHRVSRDAYT
jgi:DNA-directed RNA polymerase subunit M/transcription elongation factor TFIIS